VSPRTTFAAAINRLYPKWTHDAGPALVAGSATATVDGLRKRHVAVVTYRGDGTPVATPVWYAILDGQIVFRSLVDAGKIRRISRDPRVLVAPCTSRGRPVGPALAGQAAVLAGEHADKAEAALRARYRAGRRAYRWATKPAAATYVAVTPVAQPG
jgi:PPOX class probable F420-dependent enzyme